MALPLLAIEAVLSSDELLMASEDSAYNLLVVWTDENYSNLEKRQE